MTTILGSTFRVAGDYILQLSDSTEGGDRLVRQETNVTAQVLCCAVLCCAVLCDVDMWMKACRHTRPHLLAMQWGTFDVMVSPASLTCTGTEYITVSGLYRASFVPPICVCMCMCVCLCVCVRVRSLR